MYVAECPRATIDSHFIFVMVILVMLCNFVPFSRRWWSNIPITHAALRTYSTFSLFTMYRRHSNIQITHLLERHQRWHPPKLRPFSSLDRILCRILCTSHSGTRNPLNPSRVEVEISLSHQHLSWWLDSMCVPPNSLWTMACTLRQKQKPWRAARQNLYRIFIFIFSIGRDANSRFLIGDVFHFFGCLCVSVI